MLYMFIDPKEKHRLELWMNNRWGFELKSFEGDVFFSNLKVNVFKVKFLDGAFLISSPKEKGNYSEEKQLKRIRQEIKKEFPSVIIGTFKKQYVSFVNEVKVALREVFNRRIGILQLGTPPQSLIDVVAD